MLDTHQHIQRTLLTRPSPARAPGHLDIRNSKLQYSASEPS